MTRRVVITGCGYVSALGLGKEPLFEALRTGQTGVRSVEGVFDGVRMKQAAPVQGLVAEDHFDSSKIKQQLDPFSQFAVVAAREAVKDAELDLSDPSMENMGVVLGSSVGGLYSIEQNFVINANKRVHPMAIPKSMASAPTSQVAMEFGFHGPSYATASACASAAHAIGQAVLMIRSGMTDQILTGGTEATHIRDVYRSWDSLRVVAKDECRPFSKNRTGIVLGEGAGVYILEEYETAKARGAKIYAEIAGFGMSSDAADIVAPEQKWVARAMESCLKDAGLQPGDVDYINAHGTGTPMNDSCESKAIRQVFGDAAEKILISSTKPIHGHTLGAAAGLELASILLAMEEGVVAPTLNYNEPDPECDLNYVANEPINAQVNVALCNSFAFGGLNAVVALKKLTQ